MKTSMIIAIDGPAASGKSTISKNLSKKLKIEYLDTGAIYRSIALEALNKNIKHDDIENLIKLSDKIKIIFKNNKNSQNIIINGKNASKDIRTEKISKLSSIISSHPLVREKLYFLQKKFAHEKNGYIIVEGRDIGTVIFPDAILKIFLKASIEKRAERRYSQLKKYDNKKILNNMIERDKRDINRSIAPLIPANDAIIIDTTYKSIQELNDIIELLILKAIKNQ